MNTADSDLSPRGAYILVEEAEEKWGHSGTRGKPKQGQDMPGREGAM